MGNMSSSDAAPLPRLGEVFFDVRGNSRSMRLSWYADTGVAVFSIWQGGMCTGTFRLAIADLPRMVETLQRGPAGQRPDRGGDRPVQAPVQDPGRPLAPVPALADTLGGPRTGVAEYQLGPPDDDPRSVSTQYLPGPGDYRADPSEHGSSSPDYPAGPPDHRAPAPDYLPRPPDHRAPAPDYLPRPPGYPARPPGHAADPPGYPADRPDYLVGPPGHRAGPPEHAAARAEPRAGSPNYLTGPADYQAEPSAHRTAWNPGADRAYPGNADAAGYAQHPYPGGDRPADYRGESPAPHYLAGTSASGDGDADSRSDADYPEHYAVTVTDDNPHGPAPDSFPYGRPPAERRTTSRHAAPDTPSD
jgi:hypothetical protein